ncbi:hypothetical protein B0H11DRAFT_1920184 [Mycena galericulata]|nr:hypothetical protein B0H11DRAFT_1920184 [Mycena galericulata]
MPDLSKIKKLRPTSTMLARRRAVAKYREKNADELREKARERMARLRERVRNEPVLLQASQERAREASRQYRAKWTWRIGGSSTACSSNGPRAFEQKYGRQAWLERSQKLDAQRREAREEAEWREYEQELKRREREREAAETLGSLARTQGQ